MTDKTYRRMAVRLLIGVTAALCVTAGARQVRFNLSSATSSHLLLVTVIAMRWGFFEASVVSLVSVACLDYFFTEPLYQFFVTDMHDWVALLIFESVALLVSRLSNQLSRHVSVSEAHGANLQKLYELSQGILLLDVRSLEQELASLIRKSLGVQGVAIWNAHDQSVSLSGACDATEDEMRSIVRGEDAQLELIKGMSKSVLRSGERPIGSLMLSGHALDAASINAAASLTAIAIERARSFSAESDAEAARRSEQLRSAVLDGLAHAFKTPLTTIKSCSSGLLELDQLAGTEKRLVTLIDTEASRLDDLTSRVLRTARVDSRTLHPKRERLEVSGFLEECVQKSTEELRGHPVVIRPYEGEKIVLADRQLLGMALSQLLDNAAKYSSPGTAITIDVREEEAEILIMVLNEGSFIPRQEWDKIFYRFYRAPGSNLKASGTGIGLSVVRQVTEAHHGRSWVSSDLENGTVFYVSLPRTVQEEK
jgi:two-component system, OmpR family, sensor histidine kinase KdpD